MNTVKHKNKQKNQRIYNGKWLTYLLVAILLNIGCTPKTEKITGQKQIQIATSIFPIQNLIQKVAGSEVKIQSIIPEGANPHTYSPPPSVIKKLQNITMFIAVHPNLDHYITKFVPTKKIVYLRKSLDHDENPHIWLDPAGAIYICKKASEFLLTLMPHKSDIFAKNQRKCENDIRKLEKQIGNILTPIQGAKLIQGHPSWDQFAKNFGLIIIDTIESGHGRQISLNHIKKLIQTGRKEKAAAILLGLRIQSKTARILAKELQIPLIRMDALGNPTNPDKNTYEKLMVHNARTLVQSIDGINK